MQGLHLTADLYDCVCPPALLRDSAALKDACVRFATNAGLTVVGEHFHTFADAGVFECRAVAEQCRRADTVVEVSREV